MHLDNENVAVLGLVFNGVAVLGLAAEGIDQVTIQGDVELQVQPLLTRRSVTVPSQPARKKTTVKGTYTVSHKNVPLCF